MFSKNLFVGDFNAYALLIRPVTSFNSLKCMYCTCMCAHSIACLIRVVITGVNVLVLGLAGFVVVVCKFVCFKRSAVDSMFKRPAFEC